MQKQSKILIVAIVALGFLAIFFLGMALIDYAQGKGLVLTSLSLFASLIPAAACAWGIAEIFAESKWETAATPRLHRRKETDQEI